MDNRDIVQWAQRLYQGILDAELPPQQLRDIATAIRARKRWAGLTPDVKLAIMRMAVRAHPDGGGPSRVIDLPAEAIQERGPSNDSVDAESELTAGREAPAK